MDDNYADIVGPGVRFRNIDKQKRPMQSMVHSKFLFATLVTNIRTTTGATHFTLTIMQ